MIADAKQEPARTPFGICKHCGADLEPHEIAAPSARGEKFTVREKAMMRQALSLLLADEIQGEKAGDREAAESAQAKL